MATLKEFLDEWYSPEAYIRAHTSGSTGKPKEIRLLKSDMRLSARATNEFFGLNAESRAALPLSLDYIAGKMMAVRAEEGSYQLDILPVSSHILLPKNEAHYSIMPVVPAQLPSLIQNNIYANRIDNVLIGGAPPSEDICKDLQAAGYRVFISYGMTETCSHVALCDASDSQRIYKAMPGISFESDADKRLIISAPNFSFKRLLTNDIVELLDNKSFIWRGRYDNAINTGGLKLLPEELEKLYAPFIGSPNFYVCKRKHEKWGECICLVLEEPAIAEEILYKLRANIEHKLCPKCFETRMTLPRTINGKIKRL